MVNLLDMHYINRLKRILNMSDYEEGTIINPMFCIECIGIPFFIPNFKQY